MSQTLLSLAGFLICRYVAVQPLDRRSKFIENITGFSRNGPNLVLGRISNSGTSRSMTYLGMFILAFSFFFDQL